MIWTDWELFTIRIWVLTFKYFFIILPLFFTNENSIFEDEFFTSDRPFPFKKGVAKMN